MSIREERMRASPRYHEGRFRNTHAVSAGLQGSAWSLMREYATGKAERVPRTPIGTLDPRPSWRQAPDGLRATWLGHSAVLLESDGVRVLTDPVWERRISPVRFVGPRRFVEPPVALADLPVLDAIIVSHDHYDHLCRRTVVTLARRGTTIVTALGVGAHLEGWGIPAAQIVELDWDEAWTAPGGALRITAQPSQHFSGRSLVDRNRTLWASWVIETSRHKVFFSGDTGLTDEFAAIGARFGRFDLAMFEIGASHPQWAGIHLGPHGAHRAVELLGAKAFLPIHWGTFNLALHGWREPIEVVSQLDFGDTLLVTPRLGEVFEPARGWTMQPWWAADAAEVRSPARPASDRVPDAG